MIVQKKILNILITPKVKVVQSSFKFKTAQIQAIVLFESLMKMTTESLAKHPLSILSHILGRHRKYD
jgi:hypothetical protein